MRGVWISVDDSPQLSAGHQVFIIHGNGQQGDYLEHISRHTAAHSEAVLQSDRRNLLGRYWHFCDDIAFCILVLVEICFIIKTCCCY